MLDCWHNVEIMHVLVAMADPTPAKMKRKVRMNSAITERMQPASATSRWWPRANFAMASKVPVDRFQFVHERRLTDR
jgi:hypothetical protein